MSKQFLYVLNDKSIGNVSTPMCFDSDELAKDFFLRNAYNFNQPVDEFTIFIVGEYHLNFELGEPAFKLVSYPLPKPVTLTPSEIIDFANKFYATHPLHAQVVELESRVRELNSKLKEVENVEVQ